MTDGGTNKTGGSNFPFQERMNDMKRKKIWAYIDGKKLVEVIQAALDNNMTVIDMKALLVKENPGHEITFKVV